TRDVGHDEVERGQVSRQPGGGIGARGQLQQPRRCCLVSPMIWCADNALAIPLALWVLSWMARSRSAGSSMSVASDAVIELLLLPPSSLLSSVRVETGICAISGLIGSSSRFCRYSRAAPATSASTTSLSLTPKASLTALARASSTRQPVMRRCGDTGALNRVLGASKNRGGLLVRPSAATCWRTACSTSRAIRTAGLTPTFDGAPLDSRNLAPDQRPDRLLLRRTGFRRDVQQDLAQPGAGDAVDDRVMHLGQRRDPAALDALDHPQLPQRPRAVQLVGHQPPD